jgi:hypothetical protein
MSGFRIIPNIPVVAEVSEGGTLVSSTVPEDELPLWSAGTAYTVGQRVIYVHAIYQRLVAGTTATPPSADLVNWKYVKPTNRYAAFDTSNSTATTSSTAISMTIAPGKVLDTVGCIGLTGSSVRVKVTDPAVGTLYDRTTALNAQATEPTWHSYFFSPRTVLTQLVAKVPTYSMQVQVTVEVQPANGVASIGTVVMGLGRDYTLGASYGARLGVTDFSIKATNEFGDTVLVQRAFAKRAEFQAALDASQTDNLFALLSSIRATPALFQVTDVYDSAMIYGYLRDWGISLSFPTINYVDIQIEGLA